MREQNDRGCGGCFMNLPSQDAIGEFQTLGSNYSADYGIGSGGTIIMMIKSGQRQYHGSLYEFNRNTAYNANDYFLKRSAGKVASGIPAEHAGRQHRRPALHSSRLQRAEEPHVLLLERGMAQADQGQRLLRSRTTFGRNNFPTLGADYNYTPQGSTDPDSFPTSPQQRSLHCYLKRSLGLTPGSPFPLNADDGTYRIPAGDDRPEHGS